MMDQDDTGVAALPPAQIMDLAARCGVKGSEAALVEFAALVRAAEPLAPEEMRPAPVVTPVVPPAPVQAQPTDRKVVLEEAALACDEVAKGVYPNHAAKLLGNHSDDARYSAALECAEAVRALVAQPVGQACSTQVAGAEQIENAAKAIYGLLPTIQGGNAKTHPWQVGGNSLKQDEARRYARAAIESLAPAGAEVAQQQTPDLSKLTTYSPIDGLMMRDGPDNYVKLADVQALLATQQPDTQEGK